MKHPDTYQRHYQRAEGAFQSTRAFADRRTFPDFFKKIFRSPEGRRDDLVDLDLPDLWGAEVQIIQNKLNGASRVESSGFFNYLCFVILIFITDSYPNEALNLVVKEDNNKRRSLFMNEQTGSKFSDDFQNWSFTPSRCTV